MIMINKLYSYTEKIMAYHNIKNTMKFYEKINPFYIYKLKKIKKNLEIEIENIIHIQMSKQLLIDFQQLYIMYSQDYPVDYLSIETDIDSKCSIFYKMKIDDTFVDIVAGTVFIRKNQYRITFINTPKQYSRLETDIYYHIINTIIQYLKYILNKE